MKHSDLPWTVPIPVKKSTFTPLHSKDSPYNVEVDLSKIGTFTYQLKHINPTQLLHSDLQTNADFNLDKRLGSGRSGFYKGKYLKGIGRTVLAGNWNTDIDLYHSSGSMLASGAIREYFASLFLKAMDKQHLINPCTGLLFKKIPKRHRNFSTEIFKNDLKNRKVSNSNFPKINSFFQAITIKEDRFCRFSNIVWWLSNFPQFNPQDQRSRIGYFFELFYKSFQGFKETKVNPTAEMIACEFAKNIEYGINNMMEAWLTGVDWGSFHNNFTMDGRFLDLETPVIFPFPILGSGVNIFFNNRTSENKIYEQNYNHFYGFEVARYVKQVQLFLHFLRTRLTFLIENKFCHDLEKQYINHFLECLDVYFNDQHPLISKEILSNQVVATISSNFGLSQKNKTLVTNMFSTVLASGFLFDSKKKSSAKSFKTPLCRLDISKVARPEPCVEISPYVPEFIREMELKEKPLSIQINQEIIEAESMTNLDHLLDFLATAEKRILSHKK